MNLPTFQLSVAVICLHAGIRPEDERRYVHAPSQQDSRRQAHGNRNGACWCTLSCWSATLAENRGLPIKRSISLIVLACSSIIFVVAGVVHRMKEL